jgi:molecular chaperone GrpE (heat shock protein)
MTLASKRSYNRRSDDERISDLQTKIEELKKKIETRQRPDMAVVREVTKIHKKLRRFAQIAADNGRDDIANSTVAFIAGLDRMIQNVETPKRRSRGGDENDEE